MNGKITKPILIKKIVNLLKCKGKRYTQEETSDILGAFLDIVVEALSEGDSLILNGYMSIEPRFQKERKARDVYNNTEVIIPAQYKPQIKAGAKLIQATSNFTERQKE